MYAVIQKWNAALLATQDGSDDMEVHKDIEGRFTVIQLSQFWPPISRTRLVTFAPRFAASPPQGLALLDLLRTQPRDLMSTQGDYD